ncbi:hypothetical protein GcM3_191050 [Golovinomyces cichoracearum]|uniref:Uncharacterized protein n=1 Tax=Golovinomyces cichoracearum TaxID=62708 RepID=A0A420HI22_9PEZI|nr:hypothetical protein GcM3_191050 [Golovinomyces cichoracearum]
MGRRSSYHSRQYKNSLSLPPSLRASVTRSSNTLTADCTPILSVFTQTNDQKISWKLRSSSLDPKSAIQDTVNISTNSSISAEKKLISSLHTELIAPLQTHLEHSVRSSWQKQKTSQSSLEPGKQEFISMPDVKGQVKNYSWIHCVPPVANQIPSVAIKNSKITFTSDLDSNELHFPFPKIHNSSVNGISAGLVSHNQSEDFQQFRVRYETKGHNEVKNIQNHKPFLSLKTETSIDFYEKNPKRFELSYEKLATIPLVAGKSSSYPQYQASHQSRTHPYKLKNENMNAFVKPPINCRTSNDHLSFCELTTVPKKEEILEDEQQSLIEPWESNHKKKSQSLTAENNLVRTKTDCVADIICKNDNPRIRLGLRLMTDKRELIKACRVVGSETRLLTLRRHSLTGIKVKWIVVDNGLAVRGNMDCGKLVLRCFGESDGKVDFFTAEDISIFRFQRTVGSTRTATSFDGDNDNVYFSVRDGSWDCSARWEVSVSITKDQGIEKWLVTGDKLMKGLDIRWGDRVVGIVRDYGEHEYVLQVFPNNNWCIITALAILFDEWKASRVEVLL